MSDEAHPRRARRVRIDNRQEVLRLGDAELERWQEIGEIALALLEQEGVAKAGSPGEVGVIVVDDPTMAKLHGEFLEDPTPTDVMTFPTDEGGEIVVSIETAGRQGAEYGNSTGREACLYIVHGLLHLCGFEDRTEGGRAEMAEQQERLLEKAEAQLREA